MSLPTPYYEEPGYVIYHGDNQSVMAEFEPDSIDALVCDPPLAVEPSVFNCEFECNHFAPVAWPGPSVALLHLNPIQRCFAPYRVVFSFAGLQRETVKNLDKLQTGSLRLDDPHQTRLTVSAPASVRLQDAKAERAVNAFKDWAVIVSELKREVAGVVSALLFLMDAKASFAVYKTSKPVSKVSINSYSHRSVV